MGEHENKELGAQQVGIVSVPFEATEPLLESMIYTIRGQQVMLDSDLAMLYGAETKTFNQAVKRNETRFPERFRFQLTDEEFDSLRSRFVTSSGRGGRRYNPYVFTEQGVAMLSAVLHSETAIKTSVAIMDAFVRMRRFLVDNARLLQRMDVMEARQLGYQKETDEKFSRVFGYLESRGEQIATQTIFFDGQIYDAFKLLTKIVKRAREGIVLVDGYVSLDTLNILAKKRKGVDVMLITSARGNKLTSMDLEKFNAQYPSLELKISDAFHDRFLIIDNTEGYHVGASLKDAGKKCFGISKIGDDYLVKSVLDKLEK